MKPLFLDFDGVLCTGRQSYAAGHKGVICCLDPVALTFLERMVVEYGATIVISSSWRLGERARHFYQLFVTAGFFRLAEAIHKDWCTDSEGSNRGAQIDRWLAKHEGVECYLILDDDSDMLEHQKPFFVHTDSYNGMLVKHYIQAETILRGAHPDHDMDKKSGGKCECPENRKRGAPPVCGKEYLSSASWNDSCQRMTEGGQICGHTEACHPVFE